MTAQRKEKCAKYEIFHRFIFSESKGESKGYVYKICLKNRFVLIVCGFGMGF